MLKPSKKSNTAVPAINNTKENIINAGIKLFWMKGFASVSVDDICSESKVQKGSFYHYFKSKNNFINEVYEALWQEAKPELDKAFDRKLEPLVRMKNYVDLVYNKQKQKAAEYGRVVGCAHMATASETCVCDESNAKLNQIFEGFTKYFSDTLSDAKKLGQTNIKNTKSAAEEMFAYVNGVLYQARIKNDLTVIKKCLHDGLQRYFN